jgi:type III secretion protein HrpB1
MNSAPTNQTLVDALAAVFYVGSDLEQDAQTLIVLRAIRRLRPNSPALAVVEAQQLLQNGDLQGARQMLDEADRGCPATAVIKAMLALVLQQQRNGLWQAYAQEAWELQPDAMARSILDYLDRIARGDPFEDTESEPQKPGSALSLNSHGTGYLGRIC